MGRHACGDFTQVDEVADPEGFIHVQIAGVALCRRGRGAEKVQRCAVAQYDGVAAFEFYTDFLCQLLNEPLELERLGAAG